ncbi:L domain-like protein [Neoconidiobolus thromboides FSU 785]|nr:L domain-like protein [Neoconidiobolus thromboides FSU 785]
MRLTVDIINESECRINPLKDRELYLRGLKIPEIENFGSTKDLNDSIDLSDNDLLQLGNFPLLPRLKKLYLSNNRISIIDPLIAKQLPNLNTLILTNNQVSGLEYLLPLKEMSKLEHLSLIGNPVVNLNYYRLFCIFLCKKIRFVDFQRVKDEERKQANSLFLNEKGEFSSIALGIINKVPAKTFEANTIATQNNEVKNTSALQSLTEEEQKRIQASLNKVSNLV